MNNQVLEIIGTFILCIIAYALMWKFEILSKITLILFWSFTAIIIVFDIASGFMITSNINETQALLGGMTTMGMAYGFDLWWKKRKGADNE